jgi:hypothetical protein
MAGKPGQYDDLGYEPLQEEHTLGMETPSSVGETRKTEDNVYADLGYEPIQEPSPVMDDVADYAIKATSGLTFGTLPYLQGGVEAAGQAVGVKGASGPIKDISLQEPAWLDADKLSQAYDEGYMTEKNLQNKIQERSPYISFAGDLTGGFAGGSAIAKVASPMLAGLAQTQRPSLQVAKNLPNVINPEIPLLGDLSKIGTMDFTQAAKAPSYIERVTTGVINAAPLATAIGAVQPTEKPGLYPMERLQNATIANAINVPLTGAIEALPAAGRAAKKTGEFVWDVMPEDTKAGIKAGLEGIGPFTKAAKLKYEQINNRLVDFFSNKVIPNERKAYVENLAKKNRELETTLSSLEGELATINDELDREKKQWADRMMTQLSEDEKKILAANRVAIEDKKQEIVGRLNQAKTDYERNNSLIVDSLDKEYAQLKLVQDKSIKEDLEFLNNHEPRRFDNQVQETLLRLKEKLGGRYNDFEKELANKKIRFNVAEARANLETKLKDLENNALKTDKPNVEDLVQKTLDEIDTFMGDGEIGYDEYKTLLNGISKDPVTGKRIDPALRDIRAKANGLPSQNKFRQILDEFDNEVRERQVQHLDEIGEKELASEIKDLNNKYKDYKFYEENFLNLSDKKTLDGKPIILENPSLRNRFAEAGKKGFLDNGVTKEGLAGESLINELSASQNPEVRQLADLIYKYYNSYNLLAKNQVKETPDMLGIKDLLNRLTRTGNINTATPEDLKDMLPLDKNNLGIKHLLDLYDTYHIEKQGLADYQRKIMGTPNYMENPIFGKALNRIDEHRNNIKHNFEQIPDVQMMNNKAANLQQSLESDIGVTKKAIVDLNNPVPQDFLDKAIQNDKPLEDLQKDIRNLIISGNVDRETGGLGTDVQVLKNLVNRIQKYASEYEAAYGVPLDKDLRNMVDKLSVAESQLAGNVVISGTKGNVIASPSALAKGINFVLHGLAYLTPNKSAKAVGGAGMSGTKMLLDKATKIRMVNSMLKNYNMTIQDLKQADSVKRAAVLNSLMQDPKLRQTVKEMLGEPADESGQ